MNRSELRIKLSHKRKILERLRHTMTSYLTFCDSLRRVEIISLEARAIEKNVSQAPQTLKVWN